MSNIAVSVIIASLLACFDIKAAKDKDGNPVPVRYDVPSNLIAYGSHFPTFKSGL
jgi:hypothetical protein